MGLNSPWGYRGEICKTYGWTYDYLLWGISWVNVQLILADAAEVKTENPDESGENPGKSEEVIHRKLSSKEDIKNYIKGII